MGWGVNCSGGGAWHLAQARCSKAAAQSFDKARPAHGQREEGREERKERGDRQHPHQGMPP
eukprot:336403-Chlamydomonas_euryale.AAC.5